MKFLTLAVLVTTSLLTAGPAFACTDPPGWPQRARVVSVIAAERMVQQATYIDLVTVERLTSDFKVGIRQWSAMRAEPAGSPAHASADTWLEEAKEAWAEDGALIHYRVLSRLKGASPPEFTLNGSKLPKTLGGPPARRAVPLNRLQYYLNVVDLIDGPSMGDCTMPVLGEVGQTYLAFRDADGLPLRTKVPVQFNGKTYLFAGPSVVPVLSAKDPWPKAVTLALTRR